MPFSLHPKSLAQELGLTAVANAGPNVWILISQRTLRMTAFGLINLILALYFHILGLSDSQIGLFFTATLWGDVLLSLLLTLVADHLGRRNVLMAGSALMCFSGVTFALATNYWVLLTAAVLGVISVSGSEIGPFRAIEESTLAHLTTEDVRTYILTWYVVLAALGTAAGVGMSGLMVTTVQTRLGWTEMQSFRLVFWGYAFFGLANTILSMLLSANCEAQSKRASATTKPGMKMLENKKQATGPETKAFLDQQGEADDDEDDVAQSSAVPDPSPPITSQRTTSSKKIAFLPSISSESWSVLSRLCLIMAIDSLASGMVPFSLINYYMDKTYALPAAKLGSIMSVTWLFSAISNMFAGSIAARIGLIKTMVFTHLPSAIFLGLLSVPQPLGSTITLLYLRACLSSMDQAPRSAFISAIVKPEERTAVMGIVNVLKTLSQSTGPWLTGGLAEQGLFWVAFVVAGSLKASYDILLLVMFLGVNKGRQEKKETVLDNEFELAEDTESDDEDASDLPGSSKMT